MPGAAGRKAVNHIYSTAKPDGLAIGAVGAGLVAGPILSLPGSQYDIDKLIYLGSTESGDPYVFVSRKEAGFDSLGKNCAPQPDYGLARRRSAIRSSSADAPRLRRLEVGHRRRVGRSEGSFAVQHAASNDNADARGAPPSDLRGSTGLPERLDLPPLVVRRAGYDPVAEFAGASRRRAAPCCTACDRRCRRHQGVPSIFMSR